jgi:hypothetical protein
VNRRDFLCDEPVQLEHDSRDREELRAALLNEPLRGAGLAAGLDLIVDE